jgi:hypothetical protein
MVPPPWVEMILIWE